MRDKIAVLARRKLEALFSRIGANCLLKTAHYGIQQTVAEINGHMC